MAILDQLRVVEISAVGAAALTTKHLADWGAQVTILEPPGGSPLRGEPPYFDSDGRRSSGAWSWLSMGKTSVSVGAGADVTQADALAYCESADLCVIEADLVQQVLGIEPGAVEAALKGKTTVVVMSAFGLDGPNSEKRATDLGLAASGGWMLGSPDREPIRPGGGMIWRVSGIWGLVASLTALDYVRHGAAPQYVELSMQACAASSITAQWMMAKGAQMAQARRGNTFPAGAMRCKDGWVGVSPLTPTHHEMLFRMLGLDDVLDEGGLDLDYRAEHADALAARVQPWFDERTRAEVVETAQAWRLPAAPFDTVADRLEDPQLQARGFFTDAQIESRNVKVPRVPYRIDGLDPVRRGPLRSESTLSPLPPRESTAPATKPPRQPMAGLKILDLTWFWSGPSAMKLMGAMGADVIKVESIQRPDTFRFTSPDRSIDRWFDTGPLWLDTNTNKRGMTLDIAAAEGKALLEELVPKADIVISNFSNRVMPNLGLTNERLLELNPRVIAVIMPGYGPGGPWEDYVGYGVSFEQLCACAMMTGYPDGTPTIMGGFSDPLVGAHAVAAILLALKRRDEAGMGASIEIPQAEVLDSVWAPEHIAVQFGGSVPTMQGNKHPWMAPHNAYRVGQGDDWLTIAVGSDKEFAALASVLGHELLADDPRFATVSARKVNEEALDGLIADAVANEDLVVIEQRLQAAGVAACHVVRGSQLDGDASLQHWGFFQELTHEVAGVDAYRTFPFRSDGFELRHKYPPPMLGEHNDELYRELFGFSSEQIAELEERGLIGTVPTGASG